MPQIKYRITDARPIPSTDPERRGKTDHMVAWVEDGTRPYTLTIPSEEYTPEKAHQAVLAEVQKHAKVIGLEGTVEG